MERMGEDLCEELANVPIARPGFDTLSMSSPVLVQMNPEGKWENTKPAHVDEEGLKAIVKHLVNTSTVSAAQNYCYQCASDAKRESGQSNYVPIIMMPIYPADQTNIDIDAQFQIKDEVDKTKKNSTKTTQKADSGGEKDLRKPKKRGFVMQRLTDFDLLSQW